ncbi:MAG: hypothetical protein Q9181_002069 [Wetmoreana brouardii]
MYWRGILALSGWAATAIAQGNLGGDQSSCASTQAFSYLGCYDDGQNGGKANFPFLLSTTAGDAKSYPGYTAINQLTVDLCLQACRGHGFKFAGLYNAQQCFCSPKLPYPQRPTTNQAGDGLGTYLGSNPGGTVSNDKCGTVCPGNSAQTCGGAGFLAVYQDPSFVTETSPATYGVPANYLYFGCYSNNNGGPQFFSIKTTSTINCESYCGALGYAWSMRGGTDLATGESCGCSAELQGGLQLAETSCNRYCNGTQGSSVQRSRNMRRQWRLLSLPEHSTSGMLSPKTAWCGRLPHLCRSGKRSSCLYRSCLLWCRDFVYHDDICYLVHLILIDIVNKLDNDIFNLLNVIDLHYCNLVFKFLHHDDIYDSANPYTDCPDYDRISFYDHIYDSLHDHRAYSINNNLNAINYFNFVKIIYELLDFDIKLHEQLVINIDLNLFTNLIHDILLNFFNIVPNVFNIVPYVFNIVPNVFNIVPYVFNIVPYVFNIVPYVFNILFNAFNILLDVFTSFHVPLDIVCSASVYNIFLYILHILFDILQLVLRHSDHNHLAHYLRPSHRDRYRDRRAWREPEEEEENLRLSDLDPAKLSDCRNKVERKN